MVDQLGLPTELISSPIFIVLLILIALTLVAVFILPAFLKIAGGTDTRGLRVTVSSLTGQSRKILSHPTRLAIVIFVIVLLLTAGYLFYLQGRPQIITAERFNKREAASVGIIQNNQDYFIIKNSDMYIVDIRSEEEYTKEHIKGSFSVPFEEFEKWSKLQKGSKIKGKKLAIYSSRDELGQAREAADIIKGEVEDKVYVVKEGFEGLKSAGLATAQGPPFGGE